MSKSIISVEFEIPGHSDECLPFSSDKSLLDFDIIVFQPDISSYVSWTEQYQGKPSLNENQSFRLREQTNRWRQELVNAFNHGKTIFIFMSEMVEVFLHTGQRQYSGTGRNSRVTNIVEPFNSYSTLPITFDEVVNARGKEIKPARDLKLLAPYWGEFKEQSEYDVYFTSKNVSPMLVTRTGSKTVGGIIQAKSGSGKGTIILMPRLHYLVAEFVEKRGDKTYWNKKGLAFGERFVSTLVEIDKAVAAGKQRTPPPEWSTSDDFRLVTEAKLEQEIADQTKQIEIATATRTELLAKLDREAGLRRLLYETGPMLEEAILHALSLLGLKAERYKDSESEFDVLFTWNSHRFLGEAEGKDNKAVNVDKISQLERNLNEDYAREDVKDYAKGMLLGNAFRLQKLSERGEFFTEKCISSAKRLKAALIRTPDLFFAARYAKESKDADFARKCVEAIVAAEGTVVSFPPVPSSEQKSEPNVQVATQE